MLIILHTELLQANFARLGILLSLSAAYINSPEAISSTLADTYQRLYELPDPKLPVKYPRTPGYRPAMEDNPYNAW